MGNIYGVIMIGLLSVLYYLFLAYNDAAQSKEVTLLFALIKVFFIMTTFIYTLTQLIL